MLRMANASLHLLTAGVGLSGLSRNPKQKTPALREAQSGVQGLSP